tara:strand:+ start:1088 stop:1321 length:234 start_codon:yes stop_codon:yes gene_type:complete
MKYLKAMTIESIEHHVNQYDVVAMSISRSSVKGIYKDKNVDRIGNETITLEKKTINGKLRIYILVQLIADSLVRYPN